MKRFLRRLKPGPDFSWVHIIIYVNLFLFTWMIIVGTLAGMGLKPLMSPSTSLLIHMGGQFWPLALGKAEWWRCISYAFTHAGIIHLGFNMVVLYQVGIQVEQELGKSFFLMIYTFATLTATIAGYFWHPMTPVVGASGALFGLIGFSITFFHRIGNPIAIHRRNFMIQWAVFAFVFGLMLGADNAGHFGGAIGGAALGLILPLQQRSSESSLFKWLSGLSLLTLLYGLAGLAFSWFGF